MVDIDTRWVGLTSATAAQAGHGSNPCQGLYHYPAGGRPKTALIATHYNVDFAEHYLAPYMAARGYGFLGWNTRYRGNEAYFLLEQAVVDIGAGVRWLREEAGVERVVLLGNSGGGSLMGAYQSQAVEPNLRPARDLLMPDAANDLDAADLYISLNAHLGRPEVLTAWFDPAILGETNPFKRDPDLDLFRANRAVPLDPEFVERYRAAQRARNERITAWAIEELEGVKARGGWDKLFLVHGVWADPRFVDITLDPSDRLPGCYGGDPKRANESPFGIGRVNTLRSWLSMWSLSESQCSAGPHLARITVPALVVQSMADKGVFPSDAEAMFDAIGAEDKQLQFVAGEHYFEDGGREGIADLLASWLADHGAQGT